MCVCVCAWCQNRVGMGLATVGAHAPKVKKTTHLCCTHIALSAFRYGAQGSLACPAGTWRITDGPDCVTAALARPGGTSPKALNSATYPSGCMLYSEKTVYFNTAFNGRSVASNAPSPDYATSMWRTFNSRAA